MKLGLLSLAFIIFCVSSAQAGGQAHNPDINRNGSISIVEAILSQQKLFHEMDINDDAGLNMEELKQFMKDTKSTSTAWDYKNQFKNIDTSGDETLSKLEFLEGVENEFRMKDRNRDNALTTDEMPR